MLSRLLRRDKSPAGARIGVALGAQGMLAARIEKPFAQRPRLSEVVFQPVAAESDWPQAFRHVADVLSAQGLPTVVQVHAQLASLLQLALPEVPEAERPSALKFRAREVSPIPLDDMALDYVDVQGMRVRGGEKAAYCAVARLSQMRALRDAVKGAGLRLEAIDVTDMVLRHLLGRIQTPEENGALLFIGSHGARIIVARADQLYLFRTSNLAADQLEKLQVERSAGEGLQLAKSDDLGMPSRDAGQQRTEALLLDIQRTLDFYDSNFTDPPPRRLWVLPGWRFMPSVASQLGEQMRMPVRELKLEEVLDGVEALQGQPIDLATLAIGAALRPREAS